MTERDWREIMWGCERWLGSRARSRSGHASRRRPDLESAPYYGRGHAEIAAPFDTVYVTPYKGLGGLGGSVLAGSRELVDEARVWRRRHGGTLPRLFAFAAAAQPGLDALLPQIPRFLQHARALASALREVPGVSIVPDPPQTPLFHGHLRGDRNVLWERMLDVAQARGVWLANRLEPTVVPGVQAQAPHWRARTRDRSRRGRGAVRDRRGDLIRAQSTTRRC